MKTMFGRLFSLIAALILVSCALLGLSFRVEMRRYLVEQKKQTLYKDAQSISDLAAAYDSSGALTQNWNFRVSLSFTANIADAQALVCDENGVVILCSCKDPVCDYLGLQVDSAVLRSAEQNGSYYASGTLNNLFSAKKTVVCVPILSHTSGQLLGSVLVFSELEQVKMLLSHTTNIFLITAAIVLIIALSATSVMARKETRPLKALATTARSFGHGDLSARAPTGGDNTEEMEELAVAFNNMATSLEKSEQRRREFVANVSHELKTPMTTIAGFMDGMIDGTIPPEQHQKYMQTVSDEVRRLSRLVRSMLEISKIQDQGIPESRKQKFDICESIGRVLLTFEQKINAKHLQVEVQMPENGVGVFAEKDSITQVVYNLIDNAVKFCNPGGSLFLQVESNGVKATVSVANTGQTIAPEELPLVFDRFHKADKSRSMDPEGAGLGLYIVKTIIVTHGEDISVTSRDGVTRFSFTLPIK